MTTATSILWRSAKFAASLKLAVVLICALAALVAVGSLYYTRYGSPAAYEFIYATGAFLALMILLAVNVLASVLIRIPWTARQIGFVITHGGILLLLAGCLLTFYGSTEGHVSLKVGETSSILRLPTDSIKIEYPQGTRTIPADFWREAGYPTFWRYVASPFRPIPEPRWPKGKTLTLAASEGLKVELLDWLPAAKAITQFEAARDGAPAIKLLIRGMLANGEGISASQWLSTSREGQPAGEVAGKIGVTVMQARSAAEVEDFLHPPTDLGPAGQLVLFVGPAVQRVNIDESVDKDVPLGDSGYVLRIERYFPRFRVGQNPGAADNDPANPALRVRLSRGNEVSPYMVFARFPHMLIPLGGQGHDAPATAPVPMVYYHPAVHGRGTDRDAGLLQLMQTPDGKLLARAIGADGLKPAFDVAAGKEYPVWGSLAFTIEEHLPRSKFVSDIVPANVSPHEIETAIHAIKVRIDSDGQVQEEWIARIAGDGMEPFRINTPRGRVTITYACDTAKLGCGITLLKAERTDDPGTNSPATYASDVRVKFEDGQTSEGQITMNQPLRAAGWTFYQSGMSGSGEGASSTFSVRSDPGTVVKYFGSIVMIVGMCFLRRYTQRPRSEGEPEAVPADQAGASIPQTTGPRRS